MFQTNLQLVFASGFHAQRIGLLFTSNDLVGIFNPRENVAVLASCLGVHRPLPGIDKVLGSYGFAIRPFSPLLKVKSPGQTVFADSRLLDQYLNRLAVFAQLVEPLSRIFNLLEGRGVGGFGWVHGDDFRTGHPV